MKTIGIKLADGSFFPVMEEGAAQTKKLQLTTAHNNQTRVMVDLYRSESGTMDDAEYIDTLQIENLKEHPNGEVDLSFQISLDENNELTANIIDPETGAESDSEISLINRTAEERLTPDNYTLSEAKLATVDDFIENPPAESVEDTAPADDALGLAAMPNMSDIPDISTDSSIEDAGDLPDIDIPVDPAMDDMPSFVEPAVEETAATDAVLSGEQVADDMPALDDMPSMDEMPSFDEPASDETIATDDSFSTDGITATDDIPTADDMPAMDDMPSFDEPTPAAEETATTDDIFAAEPATEETAATGDVFAEEPAAEETPATDETFAMDDIPAMDDLGTTDGIVAADETIATDDSFSTDGITATDDIPTVDDMPALDDMPSFDEPAPAAEETAASDDIFAAEPAAEEAPAQSGNALSFTGLYDKETEMGESGSHEDTETKKKIKIPMFICIGCAAICILVTILLLIFLPTKYELKSNVTVTETSAGSEAIAAKENEIVIIKDGDKVTPVYNTVNLKGASYKIKWGDTLWDIADTYYKNPWKYKKIANYNGIKNPDHIISGTKITIPAE